MKFSTITTKINRVLPSNTNSSLQIEVDEAQQKAQTINNEIYRMSITNVNYDKNGSKELDLKEKEGENKDEFNISSGKY